MTRTRCPACSTVFRVTSEQLRAKAGTVRCGHCQAVFNAFEQFVDDGHEAINGALGDLPASSSAETSSFAGSAPVQASEVAVAAEVEPSLADAAVVTGRADGGAAPLDPIAREIEEIAQELALTATDVAPRQALPSPNAAGNDDTTLAARQAGLVAARELSETPAYDRWAAGTLAGAAGGFAADEAKGSRWPLLLAVLLLGALLAQLAYYFRGDLVRWLPATADLFARLDVAVPLPARSELVSIEASDLQADNARGLFVLNAILRNRAGYAQAWPALELTLTDAGDAPVARRVLAAADYLPPGSDPGPFGPNAEIPVRLWIDAKGLGASGYRLYIFYP